MNLLQRYRKFDWLLFGSTASLTMFGLAVLYATSLTAPAGGAADLSLFWKQAAFAAAGLVLVLVFPLFDYRYLVAASRALYLAAIVLLVAVLLFGSTMRGTRGWFGLFGFGIQPVELVKFLLIVFLARFFSRNVRDRGTWRNVIRSGLAAGLIVALVLAQPDFGSALLLSAIWFALLVMSGLRLRQFLVFTLVGLALAAVAWFAVLQPYQKDRVTAFLDPNSDPLGRGYNVAQSVIAIGSGGFFGKGLGYGSQSQLRFLPERQTDFIFAATAEELGFLGTLVILGLFGLLFYRGYLLAKACHDNFSLFLVLGVLAAIAAEAVVNIGGNLRVMPLTGVTLPFLSYGGSSLLAKCLMIGALESVAVRRV
ncbi:MAG: FtsW/RodA/SpoVE family cell cycle protein [Patescibacteria group bacterium]|nr:FtsW/RodA/SpoVE family cell cycle protein [Patescibacteria group bacterium]